ncbi:MAG: phosphoribosylanthranilate isomerase, partial [Planctomycetota bacterium]
RCAEIGRLPEAVLLDAHVAGEFGGTGQRADWPLARDYVRQRASPPLILAGGLSSGNVAEAISAVRPAGVDTASGVESSPGRKDPALVRAFVKAARAAFAAASGRQ